MSEREQDWSWAKYQGERVPPGIDATQPSVARVYDYMIGGKDNFAADRKLGDMLLKIVPDAPALGRANRGFLRRAVRHMAQEAGIRQFLDIGSGLPTQGNVHEVAHEVDPAARVVYVDIDPIVLVHARALLADNNTTTVVQADMREPGEVLENAEVHKFVDFDRPIGLLFVSILHHLNDDEDPVGITARFRDALAPGSHVAISHFCDPGDAHPAASRLSAESERVFSENLGTGRFRTPAEITAYFGDMELLAPGLVPLGDWRPDPDGPDPLLAGSDIYHTAYAGVGRKG